jgi:hypothetical protein
LPIVRRGLLLPFNVATLTLMMFYNLSLWQELPSQCAT